MMYVFISIAGIRSFIDTEMKPQKYYVYSTTSYHGLSKHITPLFNKVDVRV